MKLSTLARYGVRALPDIGQNTGQRAVPLRDIANRQRLSRYYLENVLVTLKLAALVRSSRGREAVLSWPGHHRR